jgi:hypothetical protein
MKKTAYAFALVILMLIGADSLSEAQTASPAVIGQDAPMLRPTRLVTAAAALPGDYGWLQPSLVSPAYADPREGAGPRLEEEQVPITTGAWLMGCGLVAFIISRKRFHS